MDPHGSGNHRQVQTAAGRAVGSGPPSSTTVSASVAAPSLPPTAPSATDPAPASAAAAAAPSNREQIAAASITNVHQGTDGNDGQTASAHGEMTAVIEELMNAPLRVNELPLPQPPALTAARYDQMDKALRAIPPNVSQVPSPMAQMAEDLSNMDQAIKENAKNASKSGSGMDPPLPSSQIAAFAEEMVEDDEEYGSKKKAVPTTEADNDAPPASVLVGPPTAEEEETPSPPPTDQGQSPSNPGGQQQLPIRPSPPSMMPSSDEDPSTPPVQNTGEVEEPLQAQANVRRDGDPPAPGTMPHDMDIRIGEVLRQDSTPMIPTAFAVHDEVIIGTPLDPEPAPSEPLPSLWNQKMARLLFVLFSVICAIAIVLSIALGNSLSSSHAPSDNLDVAQVVVLSVSQRTSIPSLSGIPSSSPSSSPAPSATPSLVPTPALSSSPSSIPSATESQRPTSIPSSPSSKSPSSSSLPSLSSPPSFAPSLLPSSSPTRTASPSVALLEGLFAMDCDPECYPRVAISGDTAVIVRDRIDVQFFSLTNTRLELTAKFGIDYRVWTASIHANTAVIVPEYETTIHVYEKDQQGNWNQMTANDIDFVVPKGEMIRIDVDIDGDAMIVGAYSDRLSQPGSAYLYRRKQTSWIKEMKLNQLTGSDASAFGKSVTISGNTLAVGNPNEGDNCEGAIFVYAWDSLFNSWSETTLMNHGCAEGFGTFVSLIGSKSLFASCSSPATVYYYEKQGSVDGYSFQQEVAEFDNPIKSIAGGGNAMVISEDRGVIHFYIRKNNMWEQVNRIHDPRLHWSFGDNVASFGHRHSVLIASRTNVYYLEDYSEDYFVPSQTPTGNMIPTASPYEFSGLGLDVVGSVLDYSSFDYNETLKRRPEIPDYYNAQKIMTNTDGNDILSQARKGFEVLSSQLKRSSLTGAHNSKIELQPVQVSDIPCPDGLVYAPEGAYCVNFYFGFKFDPDIENIVWSLKNRLVAFVSEGFLYDVIVGEHPDTLIKGMGSPGKGVDYRTGETSVGASSVATLDNPSPMGPHGSDVVSAPATPALLIVLIIVLVVGVFVALVAIYIWDQKWRAKERMKRLEQTGNVG